MTKSQLTIELPAGYEQILRLTGRDDTTMTSLCQNRRCLLWTIVVLTLLTLVFGVLFLLALCGVVTLPDANTQTTKSTMEVFVGDVYNKQNGNCEKVYKYTVRNEVSQMELEILNYGATIVGLKVPDKHNKLVDVVLAYADQHALNPDHDTYFGAIIGRYANRIANASFSVDGKQYNVTANNNGHALHGGLIGWNQAVWHVTSRDNSLIMTHTSADGDQGYPGTVEATVTFTLTDDRQLLITYKATSDKATPINLTTHPYFNLAGEGSDDVYSHVVTVYADKYLQVDDDLIPTGAIASVTGTVFDLRQPVQLGDVIHSVSGGGFDHNFCIRGPTGLKLAASINQPDSGIEMTVYTDQPGMQFYTGNFLNVAKHGKHGHLYPRHSGFCMETQNYPDAPNHDNFPDSILRKGSTYEHTVVYEFSALKAN